jgi:16S rRNA processing protein RimM
VESSPPAAAAPSRRRTPQRAPDDGFVAVGRVLAPFGLKGELKVQPLTDNPRRLAPRSRLWAGQQKVTVIAVREAQGYTYVTLKGFHDRTSVEPFRHALLQIPESELPPLAEGEFYRYQLLGLTVVDRDGAIIGVLEEIIETGGANDVYRVRGDAGEILLPALDDVVIGVDLAAGRMVVDPPPWR